MRSNEFAYRMSIICRIAIVVLLVCLPLAAAADPATPPTVPVQEKGAPPAPAAISPPESTFFSRLLEPERKTLSLSLTSSYDPNFNISALFGSLAALYDHGQLWDRVRSGNTAFKLEAVAGAMVRPERRSAVSINMLAVYYPSLPLPVTLRPYLEAGIGAIYLDYRVAGQSSRHNFNPQLGIGTEVAGNDGSRYFTAVRLHHISNGGTRHGNQGLNSLLLQVGRFF